ncbi:M16 family metallopeptidase [Bacteroidota bacterium]
MPRNDDLATAEYTRTVLPNGIRVVSEHIPSVRSISVGVWIATGSRDESAELSGISHFIEHMVFKGTKTRRTHHIAQRMESVGGYLNAFTTKEHTCFFARALDEHLARALDVTCDLILSPALPPKELEREKDVVLEEIKMYEDVPEDLIFDRFEQAVYGNHALGRPVIGYPETVRSLTRENLLGYLEKQYTPDRIVVAVAGNAKHGRVVELVERLFANFARQHGNGSSDRELAPDPHVDHLVESRVIQQAHLVLGGRSYSIPDARRSALSVLNTVLGGGMSSRLNQNIREKYGYCYQIYSFVNQMSDVGDFGIYMATHPGKVDHSIRLIERELKRLAEKRISGRQLSLAKTQLKGSLMLGLESLSNRMSRLGQLEMVNRPIGTLDEIIAEVDAVTEDDVRDVATDLFDQKHLSSVVFIPSSSN